MITLNYRTIVSVCFSIAAMAACTDRSTSTSPPPVTASGVSNLVSNAANRVHSLSLGESWRRIAIQNPGFGGIWRNEKGDLVISSTSANPSTALRLAAKQWLLANGRLDLADQSAEVHVVNYDYAELVDLKREISRAIVSDGLYGIGVDEVAGRVILAVDSSRVVSVRSKILALGISDDAFRVDAEPRPKDTSCANLQAACSPLNGSLQVVDPASNFVCSIGLLGWKNDSLQPSQPDYNYKVLVTASHCTNGQQSIAGDVLYQPTYPGTAIANEVDEADVYPGSTCQAWGYPYTLCRYADAAIFQIYSNISMAAGTVAISNTSSPPGWLGDTNYTGGSPMGTIVGDSVIKVGGTTGQKKGRVSHTCVDRADGLVTNLFTLCAQRVSGANVTGGDSGGLTYVAYKVGNTRTPRSAGIVFQTDFAGGHYFSPTQYVEGSVGYQYFLVW